MGLCVCVYLFFFLGLFYFVLADYISYFTGEKFSRDVHSVVLYEAMFVQCVVYFFYR